MPRTTKRALLELYLAERHPARIGEQEWNELKQRLGPVTEDYLRKLVRGTGLPLDPLVEGVRQESLEALKRSLCALAGEYLAAASRGDRQRQRRIRGLVIEAKDHARFSLRRCEPGSEKHQLKEEMLLWMLTWLENPEIFESWVELRRRALEERLQPSRTGPQGEPQLNQEK